MATGTGPIPSQDVLNLVWNPAGTAPAANPNSLSIYVSGGSAYVGSGSGQVSGQPFGVVQASYRQFQLDGSTTATGSATGTTTTGLGGYAHVELYLRMSDATGTVSGMDLFVESRLDGTNYVNVGRFSNVSSATGATADAVMKLVKMGGTGTNVLLGGEVLGLRAVAGAGTVRNIGWGDDLRIRREVSVGTTAPSFSYTIWANAIS